ncbi:RHS repeat-associated core domain-containing protein [Pseudomonas abietaniphila]|uniref:RHS repeat-associated core domain-containing protein n=1 Tax=Pseudomonas abietaniphila TaxID=89065 RepID=A0A1G8UB31_9PSED|nr:RHS repeat-associated core domain-containing protein [Pseudomonas abietaniphila]SDJ51036.1 RHS repeat-associated core domain-containing protein [Pseudomonas abietaniphila]
MIRTLQGTPKVDRAGIWRGNTGWRDDLHTTLLGTDQRRTVLHKRAAQEQAGLVYTPYGHSQNTNGLTGGLGFNGERRESVTGHYLLGAGYRAFNPVLMRFNSPDNLSPLGEGGLNPYAYCLGDPVNRIDPSGHLSWQSSLGLGLAAAGLAGLSFLNNYKISRRILNRGLGQQHGIGRATP